MAVEQLRTLADCASALPIADEQAREQLAISLVNNSVSRFALDNVETDARRTLAVCTRIRGILEDQSRP